MLPSRFALSWAALLAFMTACSSPPDTAPVSQPTSQPVIQRPGADDLEARRVPADWGEAEPGKQVMPVKLLPISQARYSHPEQMEHPVDPDDLVIGLADETQAYAWPIKMLGGPSREIVNHRFMGSPFAVNW